MRRAVVLGATSDSPRDLVEVAYGPDGVGECDQWIAKQDHAKSKYKLLARAALDVGRAYSVPHLVNDYKNNVAATKRNKRQRKVNPVAADSGSGGIPGNVDDAPRGVNTTADSIDDDGNS